MQPTIFPMCQRQYFSRKRLPPARTRRTRDRIRKANLTGGRRSHKKSPQKAQEYDTDNKMQHCSIEQKGEFSKNQAGLANKKTLVKLILPHKQFPVLDFFDLSSPAHRSFSLLF